MTTPAWSAAQNGAPGNLNAANASAQVNQLLGSHSLVEIYDGLKIVSVAPGTHFTWTPMTETLDFDQSFTMSGTNIGQIEIPLSPVGNGADVLITLWPDNGSNQPNTTGSPIASIKVFASYLLQVAAADGMVNGGPLATERDNYAAVSSAPIVPWSSPANDPTGATGQAVGCTSGSYLILLGGFTAVGGTPIAAVNTSQYLGGNNFSAPLPQTPLPQTLAVGAATATGTSVFYVGGNTASSVVVANVWGASWDINSGTVGAWSAQTALPQPMYHMGAASWGETVYVVGGVTNTPTTLSTVYWNTAANGILGAWLPGPTLPVPMCDPYTVVIGNWLVVFGGRTDTGSSTALSGMIYAPINPDGSLGAWTTGPPPPSGTYSIVSGWGACATADQLLQVSGHGETSALFRMLPFTANGPGQRWVTYTLPLTGDLLPAPFDTGNGDWMVIMAATYAPTQYLATNVVPVPYLSIPLYATGLTDTATYHVLLQTFGAASASDGVQLGIVDDSQFPTDALQSPRHTGTWTSVQAGYVTPLRLFDATPGGLVRHTVEDPSASGMTQRWSSLIYNSKSLLTGHLESTLMPNNPLNSNPTFATVTAPWTATNGVLTRTNAQTHGGFAFSGLLTPTGGFATAFVSSEKVPISQGGGPFYGTSQWYLADGWFYSTPGWPSFQLNVNWYDRAGGYLSTTSGSTVNLSAATWTHVQTYAEAPATAAFGALIPTEFGSPAATRLLYCSDVFLVLSPECVGSFTSAATVNYPTTGAPWPPMGVTQLL